MKQNLLKLGMICLMLVFSFIAKAVDIKEKAIYSTDFSEWTDAKAATSESKVTVKNKYTKEAFDFILYNTIISSTNKQAGKLGNATGGYLQAPKTAETYVMTSTIPSITKVHYMNGATGGKTRGYKLECKGDGDTDWVLLSDTPAYPIAGTDITIDVNRTNVQLRFTNLDSGNYAFLLKLDIYANIDMDNVAEKENYTLTYYNIDGSTVIGTQRVTEDETIGAFSAEAESKVTIADGQKFRGWCTKMQENPKKYSTKDIVTGNLNLYPLVTEIESANPTTRYDYNLKDQYFDAGDHEAFSVEGNGKWHDTTHGWTFSATDKIKLLMGGKGYIKMNLCNYSGSGNIILTSPSGTQIASITAKASTDGATTVIENTLDESGEYVLSFDGTGSNYIHSLSIINMTEPAYTQNGNWYTVKAGDAKSFTTTLELVNGFNSAANAPRSYIFLPNGTYDLGEACLTTISGNNISLIGESMDKTIIINKPEIEGIGVTATILNTGKNLYIQDLTLQNAYDYYNAKDAGRAICLQDRGSQTICKKVKMLSYQDTYYSNDPQGKGQYYFEDSEIHGTVDYICGGGDAYFNRVLLVNESRSASGKSGDDVIAAPNSKSEWGYIFKDCTIENKAARFSLGRSWDNITRLTWLNTTINQKDEIIDDGKKVAYFTIDAMGNNAADKFRLDFLKDADGNVFSPSEKMVTFTSTKASITKPEENIILTADEAAGYTLDKVFTEWTPAALASQKDPIAAKVANGKLTWTGNADMYMIEKNGEFTALTSETSYDIDDASAKYEVRAANEMGGFGLSESTATGIDKVISSDDAIKTVIYSVDGMQLSHLQKGINILVKTFADGSKKTSKVIVK